MHADVVLRSPSLDSEQIDYSIVVATYNRPERLASCMKALSAQDYPASNYEVLIVDDGGDESLEPVILPFLDRIHVILVRQPNSGPAKARNLGTRLASGRCVIFTDDDCRPEPSWLGRLAKAAEQHPGAAIGGATFNGLKRNVYSDASQELLHFLYQVLNSDPDDAEFLASNNLGFPKQQLSEVGGFDESFPLAAGEDRDLCDRWRWHGHRIVFVPDAQVMHYHALSWRTFWGQHFNYGRGAYTFRRLRWKRSGKLTQQWRPSSYLRLAWHPFVKGVHRPVAILGLLVISQLAGPTGWVVEFFSAPRTSAESSESP